MEMIRKNNIFCLKKIKNRDRATQKTQTKTNYTAVQEFKAIYGLCLPA